MVSSYRIFDGRRLLIFLSLLLSAGFFATTLGSYFVSKNAIRQAIIGRELPLAANNIYVEFQKDLVQPVLIASTMAHDTFLRDWALKGEKNIEEMSRYLQEIKLRYGAFSSFFISEQSSNYYTGDGLLKKVSPQEPRDAWYYRLRKLKEPYEINVDIDMANQDAMTIFINYQVFDFAGKLMGATGIGMTLDAMHLRIKDYQQRYQRTIYFVDPKGLVVLFGNETGQASLDLHERPGMRDLIDRIFLEKNGGYQYESQGVTYLLNVHYIPELDWYLFVEKDEAMALAGVRHALYINLGICLVITLFVVLLMNVSLSRYQRRLEQMASTDKLTGMLNRQAFTILMDKLLAEYVRQPRPVSMLLLDIDHFKRVNDAYGHATGDRVLCRVAEQIQQALRKSDMAVRWGGEEFLIVLDKCSMEEARQIAEKIRQRVAHYSLIVEGKNIAIPITVSLGVSQFSGDEPAEQAISRADAALYQAKNNGRNRVGMAAPL